MKKIGPEIIKIISGREEETAGRAADVVLGGGLIVYPTESYYGLGADPFNEEALRRIFEIKGRPLDSPILLLLPAREEASRYAARITEEACVLMDVFWPGGLTIVLDAAEGISPLLTAGTGKVGLRLSSNPFARALCRELGGAVTGTSANRSGAPPCTTALEAARSLLGRIDLVADGGETPGGQPSTVVDATRMPVKIIRQGMISESEIKGAISRGGRCL